jgi:hypothetical protein
VTAAWKASFLPFEKGQVLAFGVFPNAGLRCVRTWREIWCCSVIRSVAVLVQYMERELVLQCDTECCCVGTVHGERVGAAV